MSHLSESDTAEQNDGNNDTRTANAGRTVARVQRCPQWHRPGPGLTGLTYALGIDSLNCALIYLLPRVAAERTLAREDAIKVAVVLSEVRVGARGRDGQGANRWAITTATSALPCPHSHADHSLAVAGFAISATIVLCCALCGLCGLCAGRCLIDAPSLALVWCALQIEILLSLVASKWWPLIDLSQTCPTRFVLPC